MDQQQEKAAEEQLAEYVARLGDGWKREMVNGFHVVRWRGALRARNRDPRVVIEILERPR